MIKIRTHYDNLQVKENASEEVIKGAHRYLSQKWHPDKNPDNTKEAEKVFKIINEAYETLSDPVKRKEHDAWILRQTHNTTGYSEQLSSSNSQQHSIHINPSTNPSSAPYRTGKNLAHIISSTNIPTAEKVGHIAAHIFKNWIFYGVAFLIIYGITK